MKIYEKPEMEIISLETSESITYTDLIEGSMGLTDNPWL